MIGTPGTGKSHIAKAITYKAILDGYVVMFGEAEELLAKDCGRDSARAKENHEANTGCDLLVIDDLFLQNKLSEELSQILQSVLRKRYKMRLSTVITSNRIISDWGNT